MTGAGLEHAIKSVGQHRCLIIAKNICYAKARCLVVLLLQVLTFSRLEHRRSLKKKKKLISWTKTSKRTVVSFNEFSSPSSHFKPKLSKWHVFLKHLETQSIPLREHVKLPLMFLSSAVAAQWVSTYCVCIHKSVFWLRTCAVAAPVLRVMSMGAVRGSFSRPSILSPPSSPHLEVCFVH